MEAHSKFYNFVRYYLLRIFLQFSKIKKKTKTRSCVFIIRLHSFDKN